ncbi:MAG: hypothetical protein IKP64_01460, partial [Selenomonadaceae bacterium]|nr:hypothetical protein [Selenomonadaceae bacterium]
MDEFIFDLQRFDGTWSDGTSDGVWTYTDTNTIVTLTDSSKLITAISGDPTTTGTGATITATGLDISNVTLSAIDSSITSPTGLKFTYSGTTYTPNEIPTSGSTTLIATYAAGTEISLTAYTTGDAQTFRVTGITSGNSTTYQDYSITATGTAGTKTVSVTVGTDGAVTLAVPDGVTVSALSATDADGTAVTITDVTATLTGSYTDGNGVTYTGGEYKLASSAVTVTGGTLSGEGDTTLAAGSTIKFGSSSTLTLTSGATVTVATDKISFTLTDSNSFTDGTITYTGGSYEIDTAGALKVTGGTLSVTSGTGDTTLAAGSTIKLSGTGTPTVTLTSGAVVTVASDGGISVSLAANESLSVGNVTYANTGTSALTVALDSTGAATISDIADGDSFTVGTTTYTNTSGTLTAELTDGTTLVAVDSTKAVSISDAGALTESEWYKVVDATDDKELTITPSDFSGGDYAGIVVMSSSGTQLATLSGDATSGYTVTADSNAALTSITLDSFTASSNVTFANVPTTTEITVGSTAQFKVAETGFTVAVGNDGVSVDKAVTLTAGMLTSSGTKTITAGTYGIAAAVSTTALTVTNKQGTVTIGGLTNGEKFTVTPTSGNTATTYTAKTLGSGTDVGIYDSAGTKIYLDTDDNAITVDSTNGFNVSKLDGETAYAVITVANSAFTITGNTVDSVVMNGNSIVAKIIKDTTNDKTYTLTPIDSASLSGVTFTIPKNFTVTFDKSYAGTTAPTISAHSATFTVTEANSNFTVTLGSGLYDYAEITNASAITLTSGTINAPVDVPVTVTVSNTEYAVTAGTGSEITVDSAGTVGDIDADESFAVNGTTYKCITNVGLITTSDGTTITGMVDNAAFDSDEGTFTLGSSVTPVIAPTSAGVLDISSVTTAGTYTVLDSTTISTTNPTTLSTLTLADTNTYTFSSSDSTAASKITSVDLGSLTAATVTTDFATNVTTTNAGTFTVNTKAYSGTDALTIAAASDGTASTLTSGTVTLDSTATTAGTNSVTITGGDTITATTGDITVAVTSSGTTITGIASGDAFTVSDGTTTTTYTMATDGLKASTTSGGTTTTQIWTGTTDVTSGVTLTELGTSTNWGTITNLDSGATEIAIDSSTTDTIFADNSGNILAKYTKGTSGGTLAPLNSSTTAALSSYTVKVTGTTVTLDKSYGDGTTDPKIKAVNSGAEFTVSDATADFTVTDPTTLGDPASTDASTVNLTDGKLSLTKGQVVKFGNSATDSFTATTVTSTGTIVADGTANAKTVTAKTGSTFTYTGTTTYTVTIVADTDGIVFDGTKLSDLDAGESFKIGTTTYTVGTGGIIFATDSTSSGTTKLWTGGTITISGTTGGEIAIANLPAFSSTDNMIAIQAFNGTIANGTLSSTDTPVLLVDSVTAPTKQYGTLTKTASNAYTLATWTPTNTGFTALASTTVPTSVTIDSSSMPSSVTFDSKYKGTIIKIGNDNFITSVDSIGTGDTFAVNFTGISPNFAASITGADLVYLKDTTGYTTYFRVGLNQTVAYGGDYSIVASGTTGDGIEIYSQGRSIGDIEVGESFSIKSSTTGFEGTLTYLDGVGLVGSNGIYTGTTQDDDRNSGALKVNLANLTNSANYGGLLAPEDSVLAVDTTLTGSGKILDSKNEPTTTYGDFSVSGSSVNVTSNGSIAGVSSISIGSGYTSANFYDFTETELDEITFIAADSGATFKVTELSGSSFTVSGTNSPTITGATKITLSAGTITATKDQEITLGDTGKTFQVTNDGSVVVNYDDTNEIWTATGTGTSTTPAKFTFGGKEYEVNNSTDGITFTLGSDGNVSIGGVNKNGEIFSYNGQEYSLKSDLGLLTSDGDAYKFLSAFSDSIAAASLAGADWTGLITIASGAAASIPSTSSLTSAVLMNSSLNYNYGKIDSVDAGVWSLSAGLRSGMLSSISLGADAGSVSMAGVFGGKTIAADTVASFTVTDDSTNGFVVSISGGNASVSGATAASLVSGSLTADTNISVNANSSVIAATKVGDDGKIVIVNDSSNLSVGAFGVGESINVNGSAYEMTKLGVTDSSNKLLAGTKPSDSVNYTLDLSSLSGDWQDMIGVGGGLSVDSASKTGIIVNGNKDSLFGALSSATGGY